MHPEIRKVHIKRWLEKLGLSLFHYRGHRRFTDPVFYPEITSGGRGATICDVGGNVGQTSVDFRLSFPEARIDSFEPFPAAYEHLVQAAERYRFNAHKLALGETNTTTTVTADPNSPSTLNSLVSVQSDTTNQVPVEISINTLDSWLEANAIAKLDILKIDTEGFEVAVIKGASNTLSQKRLSSLIVEVGLAPHDSQHCDMQEIVALLESYGYRMANLFDVVHDPGPYMAYCNALFRPIP
jgi:FkbM family methyltransferase